MLWFEQCIEFETWNLQSRYQDILHNSSRHAEESLHPAKCLIALQIKCCGTPQCFSFIRTTTSFFKERLCCQLLRNPTLKSPLRWQLHVVCFLSEWQPVLNISEPQHCDIWRNEKVLKGEMEEESEVMASDVHTKKWGAERWMHSTEETFKKDGWRKSWRETADNRLLGGEG